MRGSIVDVFPATAEHPVRIDQWGDEVERLSEFSVGDQRSTHDIRHVEVFPCRELLPTAEVRARAEALLTEAPWGREQWERLAQGQVFDGMESWLPWLTADEHLLPDLLPAGARVLLVEPRRMRDRAQDLLDEEAALGDVLAGTWGAEGDEFPRLSLPFDRLLARTHDRDHVGARVRPRVPTPRARRERVRPGGRRRRGARRPHPGARARRSTGSCSRPRGRARRAGWPMC